MDATTAELSDGIWTTIVTILLALSLISERVSNFIKLHSKKLRERTGTMEEEKVRERNIQRLALFSGLLVSAIAGADLFNLLKGKEGGLLGFSWANFGDPTIILGMILTGFFISLGSKFWHDMLDIVLQFSELKKFQAKKQDIDNQDVVARGKEKILLDTIAEMCVEITTLPGFQSMEVKNNTPVITFEETPSPEQQDFLKAIFPVTGFRIAIASELQGL